MSDTIKKSLKILGIMTLALLLFAATIINVWYLWILIDGKQKNVSKTFNVGSFKLADGTQKRFIELEYWANEDNSGYECLEIKFNYLIDETKEGCYSQGLQFVKQNEFNEMKFVFNDWDLREDIISQSSTGFWFWKKTTYKIQRSFVFVGGKSYNYISAGSQYLRSTNPIDSDTAFKIEIGEKIYQVKFKGSYNEKISGSVLTELKTKTYGTPLDETTLEKSFNYGGDTYYFYREYDINYLIKALFESVKSSKLGTSAEFVFEFGNLFDYFEYDPISKTYNEERTSYENIVKIVEDIKSYYSILVKTHEEGLTRSSESMFKSILGNQSLNLTNNIDSSDYFIGRTLINVDLTAFDIVLIDNINAALKLNKQFFDYYSQYAKSIELSIVIDIDTLTNLGYSFVGFTADSNIDKFDIHSINLLSNGIKTPYTMAQGGDLC